MMTTANPAATTWWVEIFLGETDGVSTATARLHSQDRTNLVATGEARLNPRDRDIPEIGYELAVARALSRLAHDLLETTANDICGVTLEAVSAADLEKAPSS